MKIKNTYILAAIISLGIIFCFTTCKKYDEDGKRSWHKPGKRILGTWYLKEFLVDGADSVNTWYEKKTTDISDTIKWQLMDTRIKFEYEDGKDLDVYVPSVCVYNSYYGKFYYLHLTGRWNLENSNKQLDFDSKYSFVKDVVVTTTFSIFGDVTDIWNIKKLTDKEIILEADRNDNKHLRIKMQR